MTEEELVDHINNIVSAEADCKRIIIWNVRHMRELKKLEQWLRDEQRRTYQTPQKA